MTPAQTLRRKGVPEYIVVDWRKVNVLALCQERQKEKKQEKIFHTINVQVFLNPKYKKGLMEEWIGLFQSGNTTFEYHFLVTLFSIKVMGRNTSVSLGDYFENFVDGRISEGRYKNVSEVIRAGLRLLEEEENRILSLKRAIREGAESGIAVDFDADKHLVLLKAGRKTNG